ncbi:MmpS family transport accessory protein [Mycobacterium pseudoshottsii]|uniref:MmpS family transport accessory protein n=1 Tax=Mycobacterium pseudoshottsii TaxID=265949 RepID=UPI00035889DE|nr:MmpS family transport accessory protein [Mycobacterium pseudoshottsii]EPQ47252.1 membrane protein [Mycobacterium sp. 012931]
MPLVLAVVFAVGGFAVSRFRGFAVSRVRGMFGSQQLPTYADSTPAGSVSSSGPKRVRYEIFGAPGTIADINYMDPAGEAQQLNDVALPWSIEVETDAPSMVANIIAQGNSDFLGCRISSDGEVKDERTSSAVSAYVYCIAKSA